MKNKRISDFKIKTISQIRKLNIEKSSKEVKIEGWITNPIYKEKVGKFILTDSEEAITCMFFRNNKRVKELEDKITKNQKVRLTGILENNIYNGVTTKQIKIVEIQFLTPNKRLISECLHVKNPELFINTSASGGSAINVITLKEIISKYESDVIGICDYATSVSFPKFEEFTKEAGKKAVYSIEFPIQKETKNSSSNTNGEVIWLDVETTGFDFYRDEIIEIGAVKVVDGVQIASFNELVKPTIPIPVEATNVNGITDEMVANSRSIKEVLSDFLIFVNGCEKIGGQNVEFDINFLKTKSKQLDLKFEVTEEIDTLLIARKKLQLKNYKLETICKLLKIDTGTSHRAYDDALATFNVMKELEKIEDLPLDKQKTNIYNIEYVTLTAKNQKGLVEIYKLLTKIQNKNDLYWEDISNLKDAFKVSGWRGEINNKLKKLHTIEDIKQIILKYDFLVVSTDLYKEFFDKIKDFVKDKIIFSSNARVVSDYELLAFTEFSKAQYKVKNEVRGVGKDNHLIHNDVENIIDYFDFKEGLEFHNRNVERMTNEIEEVVIVPENLFKINIPHARDEIIKRAEQKLLAVYGLFPPKEVVQRYLDEKEVIVEAGYSEIYWSAMKICNYVQGELKQVIGSRGSIGSSFLAFLLDITDVNPLRPHYTCVKCCKTKFIENETCHLDLPNKICTCGGEAITDGYTIPFETFLGFKGGKTKVPDIDLNFSPKIQRKVHKYTIELLSPYANIIKAGTVSVFGMNAIKRDLEKYYKKTGIIKSKEYLSALAYQLVTEYKDVIYGIKANYGQHSGGLLVLPKETEWETLFPTHKLKVAKEGEIVTSHGGYKAFEDNVMKLDLLALSPPERKQRITKKLIKKRVDVRKIYTLGIKDKKVLQLVAVDVLTRALPEIHTSNAQRVIRELNPQCFEDLIKLQGFLHGKGVWEGNIKQAIANENNKVTLKNIFACRDDITNYFISKGVEPFEAFRLSEKIRKGKGIIDEAEVLILDYGVDEDYLVCAHNVNYLFPRGHAVAYLLDALWLTWVKVYHPDIFYADALTNAEDKYDYELMVSEDIDLNKTIDQYRKSKKDFTKIPILELIQEMQLPRFNYKFGRIDITKSTKEFVIENKIVFPTFRTIKGVGQKTSDIILNEQKINGKFKDEQDFRKRVSNIKTVAGKVINATKEKRKIG